MAAKSCIGIVVAMIISQVASQANCPVGSFDVRYRSPLQFHKGVFTSKGRLQLQCEGSAYCSFDEAQATQAICTNENRVRPLWNCVFTFPRMGYSFSDFSVECNGYSDSTPCVPENSCMLRYTLFKSSQPVAVYSGVGGTVSFIIFCAIVYWCCCRKRKTENRVVNIIRTEPAPSTHRPASPPPAATQTHVTVNVTGLAPAPPAPAPAPMYIAAPQPPMYVPPAPPFNPHYVPTAPSR